MCQSLRNIVEYRLRNEKDDLIEEGRKEGKLEILEILVGQTIENLSPYILHQIKTLNLEELDKLIHHLNQIQKEEDIIQFIN